MGIFKVTTHVERLLKVAKNLKTEDLSQKYVVH